MPDLFLRPRGLPRALRLASTLIVLTLAAGCDGGTESEPEPNPIPEIVSVTPDHFIRGAAETVVTVRGTGFVEESGVRLNGAARPTEFVSATQLRARISAADLAEPRLSAVTVHTPAPGGGTSGPAELWVFYPEPRVASVTPAGVPAGAPVTVTVRGESFLPQTRAELGSRELTVTYVSPTEIRVALTAEDVALPGERIFVVRNPEPGGGAVAAFLTVGIPTPVIAELSPASVGVSEAAALTVRGSGFYPRSRVRVGGVEVPTTPFSHTELRAAVPAGMLASSGIAEVRVENSTAPGGGIPSNGVPLEVRAPVPVVSGLLEASTTAGRGGFIVVVNGSGFAANAEVRFDGAPRATRFRTPTQVEATLTAEDVAVGGIHHVTVSNPAPGGGLSAPLRFTVLNVVPQITDFRPFTVVMGSAGQSVTLIGSGFTPGSEVVVRPYPPLTGATGVRPTTYVSPTELRVALTTADLAGQGTLGLSVRNPLPGGGVSGEAGFAILAPAPVLASLSPASTLDGQTSFTLAVNGTGFAPSTVVEVGGRARPTRFVSATRLEATLGPEDVGLQGTLQITVMTPEPGGGLSDALPFEVRSPVPVVTSLSPAQTQAGQDYFVVVVNGTGFRPWSRVRLNGEDVSTVYRTATEIEAHLWDVHMASPRTVQITVVSPAPGGGVSNAAPFQIVAPVP
ncbi:MAG TPA: IPT/TIG domain-containing protein [Longimicrobium sp.]|nr:IPT/TIG domain-containing protein [Longimicrobium sp.]